MKSALVPIPFFINTSFDFFPPAMAPQIMIEILPLLKVGARHSLLNFFSVLRQTLGCEDSLPISKLDSFVQITFRQSSTVQCSCFLQKHTLLFVAFRSRKVSWQPREKHSQIFSVHCELCPHKPWC